MSCGATTSTRIDGAMRIAWGILSAALLCASAAGQDYPGKPVRLLIGFPPGGNVDVVGRIVAQKMGEGFHAARRERRLRHAGGDHEEASLRSGPGFFLHLHAGNLSAGVLGALRLAFPDAR